AEPGEYHPRQYATRLLADRATGPLPPAHRTPDGPPLRVHGSGRRAGPVLPEPGLSPSDGAAAGRDFPAREPGRQRGPARLPSGDRALDFEPARAAAGLDPGPGARRGDGLDAVLPAVHPPTAAPARDHRGQPAVRRAGGAAGPPDAGVADR